MRANGYALHIAKLIAEEAELSARCDARVFLAQGPGSGVAWIGEEFILTEFGVKLFEAVDGHIGFAAYLDFVRNMLAAQLVGDGTNGADVGGPVFADHAIATCGPDC